MNFHDFTVERAVSTVNVIYCQENSNYSWGRATFYFSVVFSWPTPGKCPGKILKESQEVARFHALLSFPLENLTNREGQDVM